MADHQTAPFMDEASRADAPSSSERSLPGETPAAGTRPQSWRSRHLATASAVWRWVLRAGEHFSAINGTVWSSSFAYYAFFALVPLLLLVVTIATDITARAHGEAGAKGAFAEVVANIPLGAEGRHMIETTLQGVMQSRGKIGVLAVLGLLWSSLGFFQSLVCAINQAWGESPLNWWKLPLQNLKMLGILLSALVLGNVLPAILSTTEHYHAFGAAFLSLPAAILRALAPSLVLFYGFLMFYKLAPRRRTRVTFREVWIPALVVTVLLEVCQLLLTLYTTHITNFNAVYGAFGGVVAMLLWIYLSGTVIVFGGCLCAAHRQMKPPVLATEEGKPAAGIVAST